MPSQYRRLRIHRRGSDHDHWLEEMGLFRKHIINDSNSLFRIVSENILNTQSLHDRVRKECTNYLASNESKFQALVKAPFDKYVKELANPATYGTLTEVAVMSHLYRHDFIIFHSDKGPNSNVLNGYGQTIYLFFIKETKHFDALFSKNYIQAVSFCQSIAYGILYEGVFQMTNVQYAVKKMLHNDTTSNLEYVMTENMERRKKIKDNSFYNSVDFLSSEIVCYPFASKDDSYLSDDNQTSSDDCHSKKQNKQECIKFKIYSPDGQLITIGMDNAKELLNNKILPFSFKTAKALDPNTYKNMELDMWNEIKRDEQSLMQYCDGLSLRVGVKCLCTLDVNDQKTYHCHIQDMQPNNGPCVVFIEELGEKRTLQLEQLKPLPADEAKPWYAPYKKGQNKYTAVAHILRQIGYFNQTSNLQKFRNKIKKSGHDLVKLTENNIKSNADSKLILQDKLSECSAEDSNNNVIWDNESVDSYPYSKQEHMENAGHYLEKYTKLDYFNFEPQKLQLLAMPLVVEQNSGGSSENGTPREGTVGNRQLAYYTVEEEIHVTIPIQNGNDINQTPLMSSHPHGHESTPTIAAYTSQNPIAYSSPCGAYPTYCMPSTLGHPPPACPPRLPPGVNCAVQRSVNANGSDLPYHDISTLRFFFNLGVDIMCGSVWPMLPPPSAPQPPHYPPRTPHVAHTTPTHLAIDLQQNLNLDDSPTVGSQHQDQSKVNTNSGNKLGMQKNNGRNYENFNKGGRGGPHNSRFKRNDGPGDRNHVKNGQGYGRNQPSNNTNHRNGTSQNKNNQGDSHAQDNHDNKEQSSQENSSSSENNFGNIPFVSYPPPPLYRISCYPGDGDGSMMPMGYPPHYYFGPAPEDPSTGPPSMEGPYIPQPPPPYLGYMHSPQPIFYPPPSTYNYLHPYMPPNTENQSK